MSQRMPLDDRARGDLRTLAVVRRMAAAVLDTGVGCKADVLMSHPFHVNTLSREYWQGDEGGNGRGTATGYLEHLDRRLATASAEDMEYYMRSGALMLHAPFIAPEGENPGYYNLTEARVSYLGAMETLGDLALTQAVLRRYPHVRFNPRRYVRWRIHWDDIDREGVPRVSVDGYEI